MTAMLYRVTAVNEPGSANRVHDDEFARRLGFRSGLVPGAAVYGYLAVLPERRWGEPWLSGGTLSARFLSPFYDGEEVTVTAAESEAGLELEARNPAGEVCTIGRAAAAADEPAPDVDRYPVAALPAGGPGPRVFTEGEVLGTLRTELRLEPAWPARLGNAVLMANVQLPPWIHVETRTRHVTGVSDGEPVEVRALVAGTWERRGHRFVDLDVLVLGGGGRAAAQIRHVAIVQLAKFKDGTR